MTGKQKMLRVLAGEYEPAMGSYWWGLYKFRFAGLIEGCEGERRA